MKKVFYIALFLIAFCGCKKTPIKKLTNEITFEVLPSNNTYIAGDTIQLQFRGKKTASPLLWLSSAFGSTLIEPILKEDRFIFTLPIPFSQKAGSCNWQLINDTTIYTDGSISILPNTHTKIQMESFIGPKSITAGGADFSMLVISPTDVYDNPLPDTTQININHQFDSNIENESAKITNGIAWKNVYSTKKAGRMATTAFYESYSSKEMIAKVNPAKALDFTINYSRNHSYADGNQIIIFSTNIIKDEFKNIVNDGTLVSFIVKDSKGMLLKTVGTTINGIAKGGLLHPNEPEDWAVTGYVTGAAKSNTIVISFEPAVKDFQVVYSSNGRNIQIEKILSFMHQLVPDGIPVDLEIKNEAGVLIATKQSTSRLGHAEFLLPKDFYPNSTYIVTIRAAGITKNKTIILQ